MKLEIGNRLSAIGIVCILVIGLTHCKSEKKPSGFTLQRFDVISSQLDSVINGMNDSTFFKERIVDWNEIIVMLLSVYDSKPEFCFTTADRNDVARDYIYLKNRRIVGYLERGDVDFIVLSTESDRYNFEDEFYKFILPTRDKKCFDYIYFPDDQYHATSYGTPYPPSLFNPKWYYFIYTDNQIIPRKTEPYLSPELKKKLVDGVL